MMKKLLLFWIVITIAGPLLAQFPRNAAGQFEYSQSMSLDNSPISILQQRATKFFNLPMLVHWDSTYTVDHNGVTAWAGDGYIEVNTTAGFFGSRTKVGLRYVIIPANNGYQYSINQLVIRGKEGKEYPLEEKPAELKHKYYDQILNRTQHYLQRVIGYMKREMNGIQ